MTEIRYPEVTVELVGQHGSAYNVIGIVRCALRDAGVSEIEVSQFHTEATSGDYDNLLQTCMRWVDVV